MLIESILALLAGILCGVITGLIPGIHVNLIAVFLLSISSFFLYFSPLVLTIFIVAMALTHTFLDFIPSIFLGAPDEDTALSILPGHELLNKGKGFDAIIYTLYGSSLGTIIILISTPFFIFFLPLIFPYLKTAMFLILIAASIYLIIREEKSKFWAFVIFMLAGFLGLSTLNLNIKNSLLPLLTGLFGSSSLITSIMKKKKIPKQKLTKLKEIKLTKEEIKSSGIAAILAAPLCTFLPSLGSSQAAVIGSDITGEANKKQFLILLGSINTIVAGLSFITLFSIHQTRTGAAVALSKIISSLSTGHLLIILTTIVISSIPAFFLALYIGKIFAKNITKFNYTYLSVSILLLLSLMSIIFSGFLGLIIFIIATSTGLAAILLSIRRTHLMGSLMIPAIILYLPL
jgi:putative membrane protein